MEKDFLCLRSLTYSRFLATETNQLVKLAKVSLMVVTFTTEGVSPFENPAQSAILSAPRILVALVEIVMETLPQ